MGPIELLCILVGLYFASLGISKMTKAHRLISGIRGNFCFYDCINCANCYSGNQRGGPCDECVGGSNYEEIRGGCDEKDISSN